MTGKAMLRPSREVAFRGGGSLRIQACYFSRGSSLRVSRRFESRHLTRLNVLVRNLIRLDALSVVS